MLEILLLIKLMKMRFLIIIIISKKNANIGNIVDSHNFFSAFLTANLNEVVA